MNPLMFLGLAGKALTGLGGGAQPTPAAAPPPPVRKPIPEGSAAGAAIAPGMQSLMGNMLNIPPEQMGSIMGTLRSPSDPQRPDQPGVVAPESGRAMNPQFTQQLIQQLLMNNQPQTPQLSLGQMLAGR